MDEGGTQVNENENVIVMELLPGVFVHVPRELRVDLASGLPQEWRGEYWDGEQWREFCAE